MKLATDGGHKEELVSFLGWKQPDTRQKPSGDVLEEPPGLRERPALSTRATDCRGLVWPLGAVVGKLFFFFFEETYVLVVLGKRWSFRLSRSTSSR